MKNQPLTAFTLIALSLNLAGCGNSDSGPSASGGSTSTVVASGGTVSGGTGKTGGTLASGGATQAPSGGRTGGTVASGGATQAPSGGTTGKVATTASTGGQSTGGQSAGGAQATGGDGGLGGKSTNNTGGTATTGGASNLAGGHTGMGGTAAGGSNISGSPSTTGGRSGTGGATVTSTGGSSNTGPCSATASKTTTVNASGTGPHKVVVESNSDSQIACGTIYRPADLGGTEKYPIFVWGEGACSRSGTANTAAMGEIASHGYFVVADGPPSGGNCPSISMPSSASDLPNMAKPLLDYITWAIAENEKPCSAYYHSIDTTKIASNGFSCGGLMSEGTASDARMTTWGVNSSGLTAADQNFYKKIHTPVLVVLGGTSDIAYENGERDYTNISAIGVPIMLFSKNIGHGGDLGSTHGGDFAKIDLAWLNWWLKGDLTATGKGLLVGSGCTYCTNSAWEVKSANLP